MKNPLPKLQSSIFWQRMGLALGGIILGTTIGEVIGGDRRMFVALVALCATTVLVHLFAVEDQTTRATTVMDLFRCLSSEWDSIRAKFGLDVRVQLVDDLNSSRSVDLDQVSQAMLTAKFELRVADIGSTHFGPDLGIKDDLRTSHLQRLIDRASDPDSPLHYSRIYQVLDLDSTDLFEHDPALKEHKGAMCDLQARFPDRIFFGIVPPVFPYSWIIIDQEILILELYRYRRGDTEPRYNGAIIVRDPSKELIEPFIRMWNELERECRPYRDL